MGQGRVVIVLASLHIATNQQLVNLAHQHLDTITHCEFNHQMTKRLNSLHDIVAMFGGSTDMAKWASVNPSAVANWLARGGIPPCWHLRLMVEANRRACTIDPLVFGLEGQDAADLQAMMIESAPSAPPVHAAASS